ncbi:MAG: hypothetical protein QXL43_00335, partial [Methanolinea sp.]
KLELLRAADLDPSLIELTEFSDKKELLLAGPIPGPEIGRRKAMSELRRISTLRDQVAHAAGFVDDHRDFQRFVDVLASAEAWIARLQDHE